MRSLPRRRWFWRWLLTIAALAEINPAGSAWAQQRQTQVLVLYSTRRDAQIAVVGDRELPRVLEQRLPEGLDYYSEFIDRARFFQEDYQANYRDFLRLKYQHQSFDLVIAMDDLSLDFADRNRQAVFPGTPIVFFSSRASPSRPAHATGVVAALNLASTLDLARTLQPDVRHVFVVSGAGTTGRVYADQARAQLGSFESQVAITYLSGLPTWDLEARLASLPAHSIVYYLIVERDGAGEHFHPLEYLDRLTAVANAPVYSWVDSAMGHGIVGGSLKNQLAETRAVAGLAIRVLHGEPADSIPLSAPDLNERQVDWRLLQRWGIPESRVPAGTLVRFREASLWERYQAYILAAVAILLGQTALIAGLLVQRRRRQRAEMQLRGKQAELRTSFERIRDLGGRLLSAQDTERSRIARELHDDISQQMALLIMDLQLLGRTGRDTTGAVAGEVLTRAQDVAKSVHDLSHRLHSPQLRLLGLVALIDVLRRELSQRDMAIAFAHANVPPTLPADLTLCLYRIVQEALQNALKYGRAREVSVQLRGSPDSLTLTIVDDGVGFEVDAAWGKGLGLISMRERVEAIGGSLEIRSRPGAGTRLTATVPIGVVRNPEAASDAGLSRAEPAAQGENPEPVHDAARQHRV